MAVRPIASVIDDLRNRRVFIGSFFPLVSTAQALAVRPEWFGLAFVHAPIESLLVRHEFNTGREQVDDQYPESLAVDESLRMFPPSGVERS